MECNNRLNPNYFNIHLLLFRVVGFTKSEQGKWYKFYSNVFHISFVVFFITVAPEYLKMDDDVDKVIRESTFIICLAITTVKMVTLRKNWPTVLDVLDKLQTGCCLPDFKRGGSSEAKWLRRCDKFTKLMTVTGVTQTMLTLSAWGLVTALSFKKGEQLMLPFGKFPLVFGIENYYVQFMVQIWVFYLGSVFYVCCDFLYATFLIHICVQFTMIGNRFKRIIPNYYKNMGRKPDEISWSYLREELKNAILHHNEILDICDKVENIFHIINLPVFMGLCLIICFDMFQASMIKNVNANIFQVATLIVLPAGLCGILSYAGNEVMLRSVSVAEACWEVDFTETDLRFQRSLIIILARSRRPVVFTVGKFQPLSLTTFVGMLKLSFSYLMFLRNVNQ